jgi:hypothetical protein
MGAVGQALGMMPPGLARYDGRRQEGRQARPAAGDCPPGGGLEKLKEGISAKANLHAADRARLGGRRRGFILARID